MRRPPAFALAAALVALGPAGCTGDEEGEGRTQVPAAQPPRTAAAQTVPRLPDRIDDAALARDRLLQVDDPDRFGDTGIAVVAAGRAVRAGQVSLRRQPGRYWFVVADEEGRCEGGVVEDGLGRPYRPSGPACSAAASPP